MNEPLIGWEQYFINNFSSQSLVDEVIQILVKDDLEIVNFSTNLFD